MIQFSRYSVGKYSILVQKGKKSNKNELAPWDNQTLTEDDGFYVIL